MAGVITLVFCGGQNLLLQDGGDQSSTLLKVGEKIKVDIQLFVIVFGSQIADFGFSARFAMGGSFRMEGVDADSTITNTNATRILNQPLSESPLRILQSVVGSPFYVAPEVLQARGYDGPKADIWSLGVILYAMLAGNLPFEQELATCKRFRLFCKWVRDSIPGKAHRYWEDNGLEYPQWLFPAKFSLDAKSLIVSMLHPDPEMRITVSEAMLHPLLYRPVLLSSQRQPLSTSPLSSADDHSVTSSEGAPMRIPESNIADDDDTANKRSSRVAVASTVDDVRPRAKSQENAVAPTLSDDSFRARNKSVGWTTEMELEQQLDLSTSGVGSDRADSQIERDDDDYAQMEEDDSETEPDQFMMEEEMPAAVNNAPFNNQTKNAASMQSAQSSAAAPQSRQPHSQSLPVRTGATVPSPAPTTLPPLPPLSARPSNDDSIDDLLLSDRYMDSNKVRESELDRIPVTPMRKDRHPNSMNNLHGMLDEHGENRESHIPHFSDLVKRSSRFITAVPATEVLDKVEGLLELHRQQRTATPIGIIGKVVLHWDSYRLEVWGQDVSGPSLCALQIYRIPAGSATAFQSSPMRDKAIPARGPSTAASAVSSSGVPGCFPIFGGHDNSRLSTEYLAPTSSMNLASRLMGHSPDFGAMGDDGQQHLYLVEFLRYVLSNVRYFHEANCRLLSCIYRNSLDIFLFKRFYQWVRQRLSELVKRDYNFKLFDQAASPM
jgi:serine/threonine protein kinase